MNITNPLKKVNPFTIISIKLKYLNLIQRRLNQSYNTIYSQNELDYYYEILVSDIRNLIEQMNYEINQYKFKVQKKNLISKGWSLRRINYKTYFIAPELKNAEILSLENLVENKDYIRIKGL